MPCLSSPKTSPAFCFSFHLPSALPGNPVALQSGKLVYGRVQRGGLLAVAFALVLSIRLSCSSADKWRWQTLSGTCGMETDVS